MTLKIWQAGEAVLRQESRPLTTDEILSGKIQDLIGMMRETVRDAPGVGLAAPQVGVPLQLAVVEDRPEYLQRLRPDHVAERNRHPVPFHVLINPKLTIESEERAEFFEGCLSVAGFTAIVPRALRVRVDYLNEQAEPKVVVAEGWYARILQHEIDHLHGILYIDRMQSRSFCTIDNYTRHWKDHSVPEFRQFMGT